MALSTPLVSVMVASYNQRPLLKRAIDSVLGQTYPHIQIVVADDGSTDGCRELIFQYQRKHGRCIKPVLQEQNVGIPRNKNAGLKACEGDFVTTLDGDDFFYEQKIEREIETFSQKPWASIVYSNFNFTDLRGKKIRRWAKKTFSPAEGRIFKEAFALQFPHQTIFRAELVKKQVLRAIDYYDENLVAYEDWDARIRMTHRYQAAYSPYLGSAYVVNPAGISRAAKLQLLYENMLYVIEKNNSLLLREDAATRAFVGKLLKRYLSIKKLGAFPEQRTVSNLANHVLQFPQDLFNHKIWAYLLLNDALISQIKQVRTSKKGHL